MTELALYGLPRTFTNLLGWLVEANFKDVRCLHGVGEDWKHHIRPHECGADGYLLCAKDPVAWCASMLRYRPKPLSELVGRWNEWGRNARAFMDSGVAYQFCPYEAWVADTIFRVETVGRFWGFERTGPDWILQEHSMLRGGNDMRGDAAVSRQPFDPTYYTERRFEQEFTESQLALIRRRLDPEVVEGLGYGRE